MTLRANDLISLDTNVLVHWIRQNETGIQLRDTYKLHERTDRPIYSTIVEGELRGNRFVKLKLASSVFRELSKVVDPQ
jgi:hypothetical protein